MNNNRSRLVIFQKFPTVKQPIEFNVFPDNEDGLMEAKIRLEKYRNVEKDLNLCEPATYSLVRLKTIHEPIDA